MSVNATSTALTPASACATCFIGAASTILHSFPYDVETVTVDVVPHITVIPGISTTTTFKSDTQLASGQTLPDVVTTFSDVDDMTWTVGDATLTYPTTYLQFAGFRGAAADVSQTCAQPSAVSNLALPSPTDDASFIYPMTAQQNDGQLPLQLLEYLQNLPAISSQFSGAPLTACTPLPSAAAIPANAVSLSAGPTAISAGQGAFENVAVRPTSSPRPKIALAHAPTNTHKTAVVISINTGRPIVTTKKPPAKKPGGKKQSGKHMARA